MRHGDNMNCIHPWISCITFRELQLNNKDKQRDDQTKEHSSRLNTILRDRLEISIKIKKTNIED